MSAFKIFSRFADLLDVKITRAAAAWLRLNADGTVSERTAAQTLSDLGGISGIDNTAVNSAISTNTGATWTALGGTGTAASPTLGTATFSGGGTITGASGAVTIAASGTNQYVNITPSGSGGVRFPSGIPIGFANSAISEYNDGNGAMLRFHNASGSTVQMGVSPANNRVIFDSSTVIGFSSSSPTDASPSTSLSKISSGIWGFGTGSTGSFAGSWKATNGELVGTLSVTGVGTMGNFKRGTGSPESVVTGNVGDLYTRTDGGAGTTLYVKESGSGNTGWVAK
jgi:hypothetical protein